MFIRALLRRIFKIHIFLESRHYQKGPIIRTLGSDGGRPSFKNPKVIID